MKNWQIKLSLFINYFVFAILLNSVGIVILQVQNNFGVDEVSASTLEAFKDLSIAIMSFAAALYIRKLGYKKAMLAALGAVTLGCLIMPLAPSFASTKILFAILGCGFALVKMSIFGTIGLVTADEKEHISLMSFIESIFMVGVLIGYFVFSAFMDSKNPASLSWLNVYYWLSGLSLFAFLLLLSARLDESSIQSVGKKTSFFDEFREMFSLLASPLVLVFIFCAFFYVLLEQSIMSWLPTFNQKVLALPLALSVQMSSILAGSTALGRFLAGVVFKYVNWFVALVTCLGLAVVLVFLAMPLAAQAQGTQVTGWGNAPLAAFVFPLIGLLLAPIYPTLNSLILSQLPVAKHGFMSSLIIIFSALGGSTGSLIMGIIFHNFSGQLAFYFSLIPLTILIVCLIIFKRLQKKS
jgi:fucose permease